MVDCYITTGIVIPALYKDGRPCFHGDHKCLLGKCVTKAEYEALKPAYSDFVRASLGIKSGKFIDKDLTVASGDSDVYVVVKYVKPDHPSFSAGQVICQTWVVGDTNRPYWNEHFCFLPPMKRDSLLEFTAYDSDTPDQPEFLGSAMVPLNRILEAGNNYKLKLQDKGGNLLAIGHINLEARLRRATQI